jgi:hypothetical protein
VKVVLPSSIAVRQLEMLSAKIIEGRKVRENAEMETGFGHAAGSMPVLFSLRGQGHHTGWGAQPRGETPNSRTCAHRMKNT